MDPCFRRDDTEGGASYPASRNAPGSSCRHHIHLRFRPHADPDMPIQPRRHRLPHEHPARLQCLQHPHGEIPIPPAIHRDEVVAEITALSLFSTAIPRSRSRPAATRLITACSQSWSPSAAIAATCPSRVTPKWLRTLSNARMNSASPMAYPTRIPASP